MFDFQVLILSIKSKKKDTTANKFSIFMQRKLFSHSALFIYTHKLPGWVLFEEIRKITCDFYIFLSTAAANHAVMEVSEFVRDTSEW